ncbi:hypothetical protein D9M69_385230 [compost metagenome]
MSTQLDTTTAILLKKYAPSDERLTDTTSVQKSVDEYAEFSNHSWIKYMIGDNRKKALESIFKSSIIVDTVLSKYNNSSESGCKDFEALLLLLKLAQGAITDVE